MGSGAMRLIAVLVRELVFCFLCGTGSRVKGVLQEALDM